MKDIFLTSYSSYEHKSYFINWLTDSELMRGWGMVPFEKEKIDIWIEDPMKVILMIEGRKDGQIVGFVNFYDWDNKKGVASRGTLIDPIYQNQGFGKAAVIKSNKYAFEKIGLKRIELYVQGDNQRSRHITEKLGYKFDRYDSGKDRYYYYIEK